MGGAGRPATSILMWRLFPGRGGWWHRRRVGGLGLGETARPVGGQQRAVLRQRPSLGPWRRSWWAFSMRLLGPVGGGCLLSLKVHSSLLSHFLELTVLLDTHGVVKLALSRSEAQFLNFQPESALIHPWGPFPFHSLPQRLGAEVGLCCQPAPRLLPPPALSLLRAGLLCRERWTQPPPKPAFWSAGLPALLSGPGPPGPHRCCSAAGR